MLSRHLFTFIASLMLVLLASPTVSAMNDVSLKEVPVINVPSLDLETLALEDLDRERSGLAPRFAVPQPVTVTPLTHGLWTKLDDQNAVWRLRTHCKNSISMNFGFSRWMLPVDGEMRIYNTDLTHRIRTFTVDDIQDSGELWTPAVAGNEVVIEIICALQDRWLVEEEVELSSINPGYRGFHEFFGVPSSSNNGPSMSGSCNVDVACPESAGWENEIDCVGVISSGGFLFCTGFMVNNTAQDGTPYFMTADHCGVTAGNAGSLVVYWNYENSTCRPPGSASSGGPGNGVLNQFSTGSIFRAGSATSDFTLVELASPPNPAYGVSFCGWNATSASPSSAVGIHHPNTEEKRISFENQPPSLSTNFVTVNDWDLGTTEPGSSGSPLFDQDHRVIGQLCCGSAACGNNFSDDYGRFSRSWTLGLGAWLDSANTGQLFVDTLPAGGGGNVELCSNGVDDDGDGLADCDDPDCFSSPACLPPAAGDECDSAIVVVEGANPIDTTTMTTGTDPISDAQCAGTFLGDFNQDGWYSFTPSADGTMSVSTCGSVNFDTDLAVYNGSCNALIQIACNGDATGCPDFSSQILGIAVTGGTEYWIRVAGWDGTASGAGTLNITLGGGGPGAENCTNGTDDDGDGLIDCADPDCFANPVCGGGGGGNDNCIDATLVGEGSFPYDLTGSTLDGPNTCDADIQNDVWFQYTATVDGTATIATCSQSGTNDDSVIAVYDGTLCPGPGAACIVSSDDACGAGAFMSTVDIPVFAGNSYMIQVAGWQGSDGTGTLDVSVGGGGPGAEDCTNGTDDDGDGLIDCADPDCFANPVCGGGGGGNDNCIDATLVGEGSFPYDLTGSTLDGPTTCDTNIMNDVWFQYTATADGTATIANCSQSGTNDDSVIAVYDGALCPGPGAACIVSSDDDCGAGGFMSTVNIPVFAGNSYMVQVCGWNASEGTGTLDITLGGGGPGGGGNDNCIDATLVGEGSFPYDLTGSTLDGPTTCDTNIMNDVWFQYTATADGTATIANCSQSGTNDDSVIAVYDGALCPGPGAACIVSSDDDCGAGGFMSTVDIPVFAGNTYMVQVCGWNGSEGTGTLDISVGGGGPGAENCTNGTDDDGDGLIDCADPDCFANPVCGGGGGPGDECSDPLTAVVGSNPVNTTAMTTSADPYSDAQCVGSFLGDMASDAWYQFTAPTSGTATVSTCDLIDFDSDLVVYEGACGALTQIACNGDATGCGGFTSTLDVGVTAGNSYYIRMGSWSIGTSGTGTLDIILGGAPTPENCTNGVDDDGDGLIDCEDSDCDLDPACITPPENCSNGVDDDGDTLVDCDDPDCTADPNCQVPVDGFTYSIADTSGSYSPANGVGSFTASLLVEEDATAPGFPNDTQGFSFGVANDASLATASTWAAGAVLESLNSNSGPDFIDINFYSDGMTVGCVYSFSNPATLQFAAPTEMGTVSYDTVPSGLIGNNAGTTTTLAWSSSLGAPPVVNIIVVDGQANPAALVNGTVTLVPSTGGFRRGDINDDSMVNIADAVSLLAGLFTGGAINCDDAADCNDDGSVNIADAVYELANLFSGGPAMPAPTAPTCGPDPTTDSIDCATYTSCP